MQGVDLGAARKSSVFAREGVTLPAVQIWSIFGAIFESAPVLYVSKMVKCGHPRNTASVGRSIALNCRVQPSGNSCAQTNNYIRDR
jgi:hypothetical protein